MARFIMIYRGEATDLSEMSEEDAAAVLGKWQTWMGKVGAALVDVGAPFDTGIAVLDDGTSRPALSLTGYSIVEASNLDEASTLTDGHPYLSEGRGDFGIDLFELMPTPF